MYIYVSQRQCNRILLRRLKRKKLEQDEEMLSNNNYNNEDISNRKNTRKENVTYFININILY